MTLDLLTRAIRRMAVGRKQDFAFRKRESFTLPAVNKIDLYIHIPFCKSICPYCPYNRIIYDKNIVAPYMKAVLNEIEQYYLMLGNIEVSSIYIGGGTPTTIIDELGIIIESIRRKFYVTGNIGIETNPEDLTEDTARKLKYLGVDMVSLGIQSFNEVCLKALGRNYDSSRAYSAVDIALASGFKTINIDLMFTLPGQNMKNVMDDLQKAVRFGVNQVTVYPLFTFPYSPIGRYRRTMGIKMPNFFNRRRMYRAIYKYLTQNEYQPVSVWGFEKGSSPKYSSVTRDTFIGLGAGAGSRLPEVFYFNTFSVNEYINTVLASKLPIAISMKMTPALQKYYWLYWRLYETCVDRQELEKMFTGDLKIKALFKAMNILGLSESEDKRIELTEKGAFYVHLMQNYFMLGYINRVWTAAMREPWPEKIKI
jgi:oxygen-independent coproporphyrinogen-3 oxidase